MNTRAVHTCEFDHCGKRDISDSGIFSRTLSDHEDHYYPWFCSELCLNMRKKQIGASTMSDDLYFDCLKRVYKHKINREEQDSTVGGSK